MTIRFFCACGQPLTAPEQYAGQTVRCMSCDKLQVVPQEASGSPAPPWEIDELDGAPTSGTPPSWRTRLGQAVAVVVLLGGVAGLWWLFFRGDRASSVEYDLVPRDALAFFTIKVSDVLKSDAGAQAVRLARLQPEGALRSRERSLALRLEDVDRITSVTYDFEETSWVILQLTKDYDPERIVGESDFRLENYHHGRKYYSDGERLGLIVINSRTLVVGPEPGIKRCLELPRRQGSGPLADTIRLASRNEHDVVAGVNGYRFAYLLRSREKGLASMLESTQILSARLLTATAVIGSKAEIDVRVEFPNAETAEQIVKTVQPQIPLARLFLGRILGSLRLNVDAQKAEAVAGKALDQLNLIQDGAAVRFHVGIEIKDLLGLIETDEN
jgi:hypothetical protein